MQFSTPVEISLVMLPFVAGGIARLVLGEPKPRASLRNPLLGLAGIAVWFPAIVGWLPAAVALPAALIGGSLAGLAFESPGPYYSEPDSGPTASAPRASSEHPAVDWERFDLLRAQWAERV